jgi:hypothetical protein
MNEFLLAAAEQHLSIAILPVIFLGVYVFIFALVIICLIRISRFFRTAGKEQKLIRLELGKVAEEVHLLRQELKGSKDSSPPIAY